MRKRLLIVLIATISVSTIFTQCDMIIGSGQNANVGIDLSDLYSDDSARAASAPGGVSFTGIILTVFGSGMEPINKTVTAGAKYFNLNVPAGTERHFKIEVFFTITDQKQFPYTHVRSFIGRATTDLRPGMFVDLRFKMGAGKTMLLVPDYN